MTPTITAFERSPDGGKGLARDTRVRWAPEEVGQPYEVAAYLARGESRPAYKPAFDVQFAVTTASHQPAD